MGMDVYGQCPTEQSGEYFRNNIWWWGPLVDYIQLVAPNETRPCEYWGTNDGDGLDEEQSLALADKLQAELDSGRCERYTISRGTCGVATTDDQDIMGSAQAAITLLAGEDEAESVKETTWPFSVENVREFTRFLRHCGGFEIW